MILRSHPEPKARAGGQEEQPEEWWLRRHRRAERSYPTLKVRNGSGKEIPLVQGKAVAVLCWSSCEEIPHAQGNRNPSKMVGDVREHQRADTLKPNSQKTSQSNHTRTTALSNSMKPSHACGANQERQVMVERSDRTWSTGEGNGKPLQYSCLKNPMNSMKRQYDRILKEEFPRSVSA